MLLAIEPVAEAAPAQGRDVVFLGIEPTRRASWRGLRHVFDLREEAALHVELDALGETRAFAAAYDRAGDELLTVL